MIGSRDNGEQVTLIATMEHVFSGTDTDPLDNAQTSSRVEGM